MISHLRRHPAQWVNGIGVLAACITAILLAQRLPPPATSESPPPAFHRPGSVGQAPLAEVRLLLPHPPILDPSTLSDFDPPSFAVFLPATASAEEVFHRGRPLRDEPPGALLQLDPSELVWGINPIQLVGADRFGTPVDLAWALLVGSTEPADRFISGAVRVRLGHLGFADRDLLLDDFSSIARRYVEEAVRGLPPIDIGPVVASNFRVGRTRVLFQPRQGYIEGSLHLDLNHVDLEVGSVLTVTHLPIHRLWLDLEVEVGTTPEGRPTVRLRKAEPHIDLVRTGEGAWAWVLDHAAWFLEIAGELASEEPLRRAITRGIDEALTRWVDRVQFQTVPPLQPVAMTAEYRFSQLMVDEEGLTALIDLRLRCDQPSHREITTIVRELPRRFPELEAAGNPDSVVQIGLHADALNAALHGLWRCGALDTEVSFAQAHRRLPIAIPETVRTRFTLPALLQAGAGGEMVIGVGDLLAELNYGDSRYAVRANAVLPVYLSRAQDGRSLQVGFDPVPERTLLYTDCLEADGASCQDNPLFDRLAWMAIPWLPPIGASIPLPDVRLGTGSDGIIRLRIDRIEWFGDSGMIQVEGGYEQSDDRFNRLE
ncbi:MAG: hypothetical protein JW797_03610 [Bradymonadales bacterium]|nr:hypothetical protein [Bradymonadales bacterium]